MSLCVKQLSVFLENKTGRLAKVTEILGNKQINIRALSIADTADFGILRLIVNRPDEAAKILKEDGFTVTVTEVLAVEMDDRPGGLAGILKILDTSKINIEYLYAFLDKSPQDALVVFRVEQVNEAIKILQDYNINVVKGEELYTL